MCAGGGHPWPERPPAMDLMVSSSRAILYAASDASWIEAARSAARTLRDEINKYRAGRSPTT